MPKKRPKRHSQAEIRKHFGDVPPEELRARVKARAMEARQVISEKLRAWRTLHRFSLRDMERVAGVPRTTWQDWETGKRLPAPMALKLIWFLLHPEFSRLLRLSMLVSASPDHFPYAHTWKPSGRTPSPYWRGGKPLGKRPINREAVTSPLTVEHRSNADGSTPCHQTSGEPGSSSVPFDPCL